MSRLAKMPIPIPKGVELKISKEEVHAKGPKGSNEVRLIPGISVKANKEQILVEKDEKMGISNAVHGLYWALLRNLVLGVEKGYEKRLTLIGVGFRAAVKENALDLQVGYSHPTMIEIPKNLQVKVEKATEIVITGIDKKEVGHFAAKVRAIKPPEPYKGKGIRYKEEYVRKKAGKAAKGKGAP